MKKLVLVVVFVVAIASLSSCRSKKNSCNYGVNSQEQMQEAQQEVVVACIDEE